MPLVVQSPDDRPTPVVYEPPRVVAGEPPLETTCSPGSGTAFPLGQSSVACTTRDATARTDACTFTVTVTGSPRLAATRLMAFGNSITAGEDAFSVVEQSYPVVLEALLRERYIRQAHAITVVNKGQGGERAREALDRLRSELSAVQPEVLLLEEGVNDIAGGNAVRIPPLIEGLTEMVREAKARGVRVYLGTLLPVRAGGRRTGTSLLVPEVNAQIRALAQREGATLVDLYEGFGGTPDPYIDVDDLHPTVLGYQKMAEIFFDVIRATLEEQQLPTALPGLVRNDPPWAAPLGRFQ
jgi:lysophospholipase L1-like esterase